MQSLLRGFTITFLSLPVLRPAFCAAFATGHHLQRNQLDLATTATSRARTHTHRFLSSSSKNKIENEKENMSGEVVKAKEAAAAEAQRSSSSSADDAGPDTIFDKLLSGEWPSDKVYEDDRAFAFRDVAPQAPVHILVIPKNRDGLTQLSKARSDQKELLGHLMYIAQEIGKKECPNGFRIVVNDGEEGAQSVYHLHLHILGGRSMTWPPG